MAGSPIGNTHQRWSSRLTFVLATIGFSVGLGNIWRFPYLAGENGGGAFVLIYISCVLFIGIPIVMAELALGRRGGMTPAATLHNLAKLEDKPAPWAIAGGFMMITSFLILSYYCVIGGWTLHYMFLSFSGTFSELDSDASQSVFNALLARPWLLVFWQLLFLAINVIVVSRGLKSGIEKAVTVMMPLLFVILIALAIYGLLAGDAISGLAFLFKPDFSQVTGGTFIDAMGQAFFSVGVGMAAMMTYGAYLPKSVNIPSTASIISLTDTSVALIAGLAVFPFVFGYGLPPGEGPGLVFVTLPAALSKFGGGFAALPFFTLLAVAALTSSIAIMEVFVSWGEERGWSRLKSAIGVSVLCWAVGLATVFSLNIASDFYPLAAVPGYEKATMFGAIDKLTSTIGLPLGGMLIAIFAGWILTKQTIADELGLAQQGLTFRTWRFLVRWLLPLVILVLIAGGIRG